MAASALRVDSTLSPTLNIASLNRYTPMFAAVPQKLTWCSYVGVQHPPKLAYPKSCTAQHSYTKKKLLSCQFRF